MSDTLTCPSVRLVRDIMTTRVQTVRMDDMMSSVKRLFDQERFHHAIVLEGRRVVGVISDRDILKMVSPFAGHAVMERAQDRNTLKRRVHQVMSRDLVTAGPDDPAADAAETMLATKVSCLPVVDENRSPLGILTLRDFVVWVVAAYSEVEHGADEGEVDKDVLVILDASRCYTPPARLARLIRATERSRDGKHRTAS